MLTYCPPRAPGTFEKPNPDHPKVTAGTGWGLGWVLLLCDHATTSNVSEDLGKLRHCAKGHA